MDEHASNAANRTNTLRSATRTEDQQRRQGEKNNHATRCPERANPTRNSETSTTCVKTSTRAAIAVSTQCITNRKHNTLLLSMSPRQTKVKQLKFQLDYGATCSTLRLEDYQTLIKETPILSNTTLRMYDQTITHHVGKCQSTLYYRQRHKDQLCDRDTHCRIHVIQRTAGCLYYIQQGGFKTSFPTSHLRRKRPSLRLLASSSFFVSRTA